MAVVARARSAGPIFKLKPCAIWRRGIQSDSYGAAFDIHHNTVSSVSGATDAIAIFNFGAGGVPGTAEIRNNVISGSPTGIAGQHEIAKRRISEALSESHVDS